MRVSTFSSAHPSTSASLAHTPEPVHEQRNENRQLHLRHQLCECSLHSPLMPPRSLTPLHFTLTSFSFSYSASTFKVSVTVTETVPATVTLGKPPPLSRHLTASPASAPPRRSSDSPPLRLPKLQESRTPVRKTEADFRSPRISPLEVPQRRAPVRWLSHTRPRPDSRLFRWRCR